MPKDRFEVARRRYNLRDLAIKYLGGACVICGYSTCNSALEMHHLDPRRKEFTISQRITRLEVIIPELEKCVLLCSNHHREVHEGLHPRYLTLDDPSEVDFSHPDDGFSYEEDITFEAVLDDAVKSLNTEIPGHGPRRRFRH